MPGTHFLRMDRMLVSYAALRLYRSKNLAQRKPHQVEFAQLVFTEKPKWSAIWRTGSDAAFLQGSHSLPD